MIAGTGADIIEINRIKQVIGNIKLLNRIFTENELAEFARKGNNAQTLAGKFAAKEAVTKCLKTGFSGFWPNEIEILSNDAPTVALYGNAKKIADELEISFIHVTISHSNDNAVAFAIAEKFTAVY